MTYASVEFFFLLLATALLCELSPGPLARKLVLTAFSAVFLLWAGGVTFTIFMAVVAIIYGAIRLGEWRPKLAQPVLVTAIAALIANLFYWKYAAWFSAEVVPLPWLDRFASGGILPVGISFYTLQGVAYLVDIRRGHAKRVSFLDLLAFKVFFAQLVAGPIVRYGELMGQITRPRRADWAGISSGCELFALGCFKKMVLSDRASMYADPIFADLGKADTVSVVCAILLYSVQIWADFSGYSDMGRGAARICGIELPVNFLSPYLSTSPSDFWRRWHITLSRWIRDYIYIPLGGNRQGRIRTIVNLMVTMLIAGLWHGANWTFVLWGGWHGALLVGQRLLARLPIPTLPGVLRIVIMLPLIAMGWLVFRIEHIGDLALAWHQIAQLQVTSDSQSILRYAILLCGMCALIQVLEEHSAPVRRIVDRLPAAVRGGAVGVALVAAIFLRGIPAPFIYFAF